MVNVKRVIREKHGQVLKTTAAIALAFGIVYLVGLYSYKISYATRPVPEVITADYNDVITVDGIIFHSDRLNPFGNLLEFFGIKLVNMPAKTQQLVDMVKAGKKQIYIQLNSGGGLMNVGMQFVEAMRAAQQMGVNITCIVDDHAMSMALIIFSECDERYGTFGSKIMWHSIAFSGDMRLNVFEANKMFKYMLAQNKKVWASTRSHFFSWYFVEHFENETILDVSEVEQEGFGYLRVINKFDIKNVPVVKIQPVEKAEEK